MAENDRDKGNYFEFMVGYGERLINEGNFESALMDVFCIYNNERSGWTKEIANTFFDPSDDQKPFRDRMVSVMQQTVAGLLETVKPGKDMESIGIIEQIARQLHRLNRVGIDVPQEQIDHTRELLNKSYMLGANEMVAIPELALELLDQIEDDQKKL